VGSKQKSSKKRTDKKPLHKKIRKPIAPPEKIIDDGKRYKRSRKKRDDKKIIQQSEG